MPIFVQPATMQITVTDLTKSKNIMFYKFPLEEQEKVKQTVSFMLRKFN